MPSMKNWTPGVRNCFYPCLLLSLLSLVAPAVWAQVDRGTISGTISDPTGAVVPAVQVTATENSTGTVYSDVSNGQGIYTVLNIPIGTYTVHYSKEGFTSFDRTGVAIQVGQRAQIDVVLKIGATAQSVTVSGAPVLQSQTELGTNLTSQVVTDLPLTANGGRDITAFAFSVTPTVTGSEYSGYVGGSQAFSKEVLIDGTSGDSGQVGHIGESEPPMDAVQQFQVDTTGIGPEAGRTGGGAFLFDLKSGTNSVHGSVFGILANEFLNANTWDNNSYRAYYDSTDPANRATYNQEYRTPKSRYFDYGLSAGGPLWRNRMFIFGAVERYQQSNFATTDGQQTVPTAAFLAGDFSQLLQTTQPSLGTDPAGHPIYPGAIFDPQTGDVFPGNVIPQSRISTISQNVVNVYQKYYQPTFSGRDINNYPLLANNQPQFTQTQLSFKYDFNITSKNRISSSYIYTLRPRVNNDLTSVGLWQRGTDTGGPLTTAGEQTTVANAYRVSDSYTISTNALNVLSLTFNAFQNKTLPMTSIAGNTAWASEIGFGGYDSLPNFPSLNFGSTVNGVAEQQVGNAYTPKSGYVAYNEILNDTFTWLKGRHNLKFGTELRGIGLNSDSVGGQLEFTFSNLTGAPANAAIQSVTGFGFANFLLGDVYNASQTTSFNQYGRRKELAFFAEDTFKATSRLTLDAALRWDIPRPEHEKHGYWSNFTQAAQNISFAPYAGSMEYLTSPGQTFETYQNWWQFSPHIGLAYQLTPKAVLRGSYGLYYVPLGNNTYGAVPYSASTGYQAINQINPPSVSNSYQFNWDNGYPGQSVLTPRDPNSSYVPYGPASVDPNSLTMGYTQNWNFNAQYQIPRDTVIQMSYIGNIGRKLHDGTLNPYNYATWSRYSALYNSGHVYDYVDDPASAANADVPYPYQGWGGEAYQAINPYPQVANTYGPIYFVNSPLGQSTYNAFVFEVTKRTSNGLSMDLSYVGSRAEGNTQTAFIDTYSSNYYFQDPYEYKSYASRPTNYDTPHEVKGYVNYQLPFGRGQRFLANRRLYDYVAGGWLLGGIVDYKSGAPIQAIDAQNYYPGWSAVFTNVVPHPNLKNPFHKLNLLSQTDSSSLFVDPSNFSNPADGQLGNSPIYFNGWHYWGTGDEDLSALKRFGFGAEGRLRLTLRAEFFNAFNRHHWANPNFTMGSPLFGHVVDTTGNPRQGQLGARFEW
jgi:Carboxypeptidase regulatory-like domain